MEKRKIKFRAKSLDGELIYFELHESSQSGDSEVFYADDDTPCESGTEQEYTGLKDSNGKDIYEGDIVKSVYGDGTDAIGPIEYHTERAAFIMCDGYNELLHERIVEIIGNIYENKDILNGQ